MNISKLSFTIFASAILSVGLFAKVPSQDEKILGYKGSSLIIYKNCDYEKAITEDQFKFKIDWLEKIRKETLAVLDTEGKKSSTYVDPLRVGYEGKDYKGNAINQTDENARLATITLLSITGLEDIHELLFDPKTGFWNRRKLRNYKKDFVRVYNEAPWIMKGKQPELK